MSGVEIQLQRLPHSDGLPPPHYQSALAAGLEVRGVVLPGTRDLTHPVDLITENFPYLTP